ncbi:MAG: YihY/virulence factor BrkB family protein [Thermodesulfobacteriota bacterium]
MKKFDGDHGFFFSAGITFNLLICLVPLMLLLLGLLGTYLYSDREVLSQIRRYLENAVPSLDPRIMRNLLRIVRDRKIVGILGIGGLIWTSTWFFSSLRTAFDLIFQAKGDRSILGGKAVDLFMILLAGAFLLVSMVLTSGITFIRRFPLGHFQAIGPILGFILKYIIPFFFTFWMCFLIYKIVPNKKIRFITALQAAIFTSLLWELAKQLFGWYVLHLGRFSMVYGSLGTLAIFFIWAYYSSVILLLGGEVAFLLQKRRDGING